jgi:RNA polymerase sigma factor (sigma-70 family)
MMRRRQRQRDTDLESFAAFVDEHEPVVRRLLVAGFGPEVGRDAAAEAFCWAWASWPRATELDRPGAYLYQIGVNWARRQHRRQHRRLDIEVQAKAAEPADYEPGIGEALASLTERQREVVILVAGHQYTHAEAGEFLGIARTSVQNHLERGLAKLRTAMGVAHDAE